MNSVSAEEKHKDFRVTVMRGMTKAGEDQYQISILQTARNMDLINLSALSFSPEEWETLGKIVSDLRKDISTHILTPEN